MVNCVSTATDPSCKINYQYGNYRRFEREEFFLIYKDYSMSRRALVLLLVMTLILIFSYNHLRAAEKGDTPTGKKSVLSIVPLSGPAVMAKVKSSTAKLVLVNIWSTWCQPCVEEFPELVKIREDFKDRGVDVLLVSADFDDQMDNLKAFLKKNNVDFEVYLKTGKDMEFIDSFDPRWTGALPVTFLFDSHGQVIELWNKKISYEQLQKALLHHLNP